MAPQPSHGRARCRGLIRPALQNSSVCSSWQWGSQRHWMPQDTLKAKGPRVAFSFIISRGPDRFCVSLHRASRGEEYRRALSIAVLGYGVTVRVLMLHAL